MAFHSTPLATTGLRAQFQVLVRRVLRWRARPRVCREAGGRVTLNVRGLATSWGCGPDTTHLAIDTTMAPVRGDGRPCPQDARVDEAALARARRRKEATYPELPGANGCARLVVLGCEVGGRWSDECHSFLRQLSKAKGRHEPSGIRASARHAWLRRWSSILACCASRSLALSLLEQRGGLGADGPTPSSSEVVGDNWYSRRSGCDAGHCFQRLCFT